MFVLHACMHHPRGNTLRTANVKAEYEYGAEVSAGRHSFWQRFRTRGGAMVDYFSYLQSVLVEYEGQLPERMSAQILMLTQDDRFPLSHLYRLYRHDQVGPPA